MTTNSQNPLAPTELIQNLSTSINKRLGRIHALLLVILSIPALWPLFSDGLPARFDRGLHLMRLAALDQNIRQGNLFPRWVPELMLGRGYPVFNFYGSGTYYLTEIFHLLGLGIYDASIVVLAILVILAGAGMYLFVRDLFATTGTRGQWASLVAAIAYVYSPYFLNNNLYHRGAVAEAAAQALIPWVLWCVRRIFTHRAPLYWATLLALILAALVFSHTLMMLIFPPFLAIYVLILWQKNNRDWKRLGWAILGLTIAMGISTFFWLPLILERDELSKHAYNIVRGAYLPYSTWTWDTFVASEWFFTYTRPPSLGRLQLILGVIGALVIIVRHRTLENAYFLLIALAASLIGSSWARPWWESSEILLSLQSPGRLLTLITLSLSIFTGAIILHLPWHKHWRYASALVTLLLIGGIITSNYPRIEEAPLFVREGAALPPHIIAQLEYEQGVEMGGEGSTFVLEFRPRWASRNLIYSDPPGITAPNLDLQLTHGGAASLAMRVTADEASPLRLNRFYFPGWDVRVDGNSVPAYPSTNAGLLTVDLPPGDHEVTVSWQGTSLQRIAGAISLVTLIGLISLCIWQRRPRLAFLPLGLVIFALFATFTQPAIADTRSPNQPVEANGVRLLAYRLDDYAKQSDPTRLYIYPYWYVQETPNATLQARWQLQDEAGEVRAEIVTGPYFNASTPLSWPPGTIIEDAYTLPLPPNLPAGDYTLTLQMEADGVSSPMAQITNVQLPSPIPPQIVERIAINALFDDEIMLVGYQPLDGNMNPTADSKPPMLRAGENANYRIYWQATKTPSENYHTYIHLVDSTGQAIYQSDQLPGPWFSPPKSWDTYYIQPDSHLLRIPSDAPGGLYWPLVGAYELNEMRRMNVTVDGQPIEGDIYRLPPIKIVGAPAEPSIPHAAIFDDGFSLLGYDLELPEEALRPGSTFQVRLYYRSNQTTAKEYTRFFHLYNPSVGLAAQADNIPQDGVNPTGSWVAGETIIDTVTLHIAEDATPGTYQLFTGFYDAAADALRVGVKDQSGNPLPNGGIVLGEVEIR